MTPQTIVVPVALQRYVDAPPVACRQRDLARLLAAACGAEVHLITVEEPLRLLPSAETVEQRLKAFTRTLVTHGFTVRTECLKGWASEEVPRYVQEVEADMVILGSHAKRGPLDFGLATNASAMLAEIDAEVVVVRAAKEELLRGADMVIPTAPIQFMPV